MRERILGVGVDIVQLDRMNRFQRDHAGRLDDLFTQAERASWGESLACAWALKEATLKAIGGLTGWDADWTEIETGNGSQVLLHGQVAQVAARAGVGGIQATLTRTDDYVLAMTVAIG